jgi:hypothetical protein
LDPGLFKSPHFRIGISQQMLQQIALGGTMIALPIFLQMVLDLQQISEAGRRRQLRLSPDAITTLAAA